MTRIESIQKSLSEAKTNLYALKQAGADAEAIEQAEARVRINHKALVRAILKSNSRPS
jgi:type II secretory pathway component PulM